MTPDQAERFSAFFLEHPACTGTGKIEAEYDQNSGGWVVSGGSHENRDSLRRLMGRAARALGAEADDWLFWLNCLHEVPELTTDDGPFVSTSRSDGLPKKVTRKEKRAAVAKAPPQIEQEIPVDALIENVCWASAQYCRLLAAGAVTPPSVAQNAVADALEGASSAMRSAAVKAYQSEYFDRTGRRLTEAAIWRAAGYSTRTEYERWKRDDPKKKNKAADRNIRRVLSEKPHLTKPDLGRAPRRARDYQPKGTNREGNEL